jgi:hypothetical protein
MKRMSVEEKQTMRSEDGRMEVTSESRLEEQHHAREQYNNQIMETHQSQVEKTEDGTTLILTEAKTESHQAFSSQSQESKRFEQTETTVTGRLYMIFLFQSMPLANCVIAFIDLVVHD